MSLKTAFLRSVLGGFNSSTHTYCYFFFSALWPKCRTCFVPRCWPLVLFHGINRAESLLLDSACKLIQMYRVLKTIALECKMFLFTLSGFGVFGLGMWRTEGTRAKEVVKQIDWHYFQLYKATKSSCLYKNAKVLRHSMLFQKTIQEK